MLTKIFNETIKKINKKTQYFTYTNIHIFLIRMIIYSEIVLIYKVKLENVRTYFQSTVRKCTYFPFRLDRC